MRLKVCQQGPQYPIVDIVGVADLQAYRYRTFHPRAVIICAAMARVSQRQPRIGLFSPSAQSPARVIATQLIHPNMQSVVPFDGYTPMHLRAFRMVGWAIKNGAALNLKGARPRSQYCPYLHVPKGGKGRYFYNEWCPLGV
jgi:hypothetical protein